MTTWDIAAWNERNRRVIEDFRTAGGRIDGRELVLLTTTGAKSGKPHTTPLIYLAEGDHVYVIASKGGAPANPDWYYNLVVHPTVTVELGAETYEATASGLWRAGAAPSVLRGVSEDHAAPDPGRAP